MSDFDLKEKERSPEKARKGLLTFDTQVRKIA
jgi:hypothetical protein